MSWRDLLDRPEWLGLPWAGTASVFDPVTSRSWTIVGARPSEHGWHLFRVEGRLARWEHSLEDAPQVPAGCLDYGYLVGDRFIPDNASATLVSSGDALLNDILRKSYRCVGVPGGLDVFCRVSVLLTEGAAFYCYPVIAVGPEDDVERAYADRLSSVSHVRGVTPALDLAFRFLSEQRVAEEQRALARVEARVRREVEEQRLRELGEMRRSAQTAVGRRDLARRDFNEAARTALQLGGAEFVLARPSHDRNEMVVQYRLGERRFECVVERDTLRVVDAGICLTDEYTGRRDDSLLTLESLPSVVMGAMRLGVLVVFRHVR